LTEWHHTSTPPMCLHGLYGTSTFYLNKHSMVRCWLISVGGRQGTREHSNEPSSGNSFFSQAAVISSTNVKDKPFVCTGWNHVGKWSCSSIHS